MSKVKEQLEMDGMFEHGFDKYEYDQTVENGYRESEDRYIDYIEGNNEI
jgi:hypothetical protein